MPDQTPEGKEHLPRVRLTAHLETTFDYPAEKVWPYMVDWNPWIADFVAHPVAGKPDSVGEIRRVSNFDENGRLARSFFHEVIKFDPPRQFIYQMVSPLYEYDAASGDITELQIVEFDINNLREIDGKTLYTCDVVSEYRSPSIRTADEAKAAAESYATNAAKTWDEKYFPAVKKLMAEELG